MSKNVNPSNLDPGQIIKRAFDESSDKIRVDAAITAPDGTSILIDATTDSIKVGNSATGPFLDVNSDGSINVKVTGSASSATAITDQTGTTFVDVENVGGKNALDVNIKGGSVTGSIQPEGLGIAGRNTTMSVGTSATALPVTPLSNRNSLSVRNLSASETLYIGFDTSVTADSVIGTTSGWQIGPNEGFNIDIKGSIPIYGIVATGSILVQVMELS